MNDEYNSFNNIELDALDLVLDSSEEALKAAYKYIQCDPDALKSAEAAKIVFQALLSLMGHEKFIEWRV